MAFITPFKAVRPTRDKAHLVASRPVYTYSRRILTAKLETNPYTFIHIVQPEFEEKEKTKPNTPERFARVRQEFESFCDRGWLISDSKPCLYLYQQINKDGRSFIGIIGGASVDDYDNGTIKKHEQTLTHREKVFCNYLDIVEFNAEPVLLTYPDHSGLERLFQNVMKERPEYDFTNTDHIRHVLWLLEDPEDIQTVQSAFKGFENIYIADGHHRSASSALLARTRREKDGAQGKFEMYNYFMSMFIPESQLDIREFNRLVKYLNGLSNEVFFEKLEEKFTLTKVDGAPVKPKEARHFLMYIDSTWYTLVCKPELYNLKDPLAVLDAQLLTDHILSPILGVHDLKTDKRIDFIGGLEGLEGIQRQVDSGKFRLGFALCPVALEQLKHISDIGETMPPKSTWIEPKVRSGLTIFKI